MNKADKELVIKYVETVWGHDEYMIRKASEIVVFDNDMAVILDKPYIKTSFCFGYDLSPVDSESYDNACDCVKQTYSDTELFLARNREQGYCKKAEAYVIRRKFSKGKIAEYFAMDDYLKIKDEPWFKNENSEVYILSEEENKRLNSAIDKANERFEKRLVSYLKKYGLSKINSWSYWRD